MVKKISIPSEDVILNALNHEIRREVLRLLEKSEMTYTDLLDHFAISSGKLNYHLKLLSGFIDKDDEGVYILTELGKRVLSFLNDFNRILSQDERPLLKKAYLSQVGENKSFLHIRYVGGIFIKIILLVAIVLYIIVFSVMFAIEGVDLSRLWPFYLMLIVFAAVGFTWAIKLYGPAKRFTKKIDKLIEES
ncbi:MAG: hypothetical protein BAJALOKI3v1_20088 [Promethearchaeota archaeon]|nr:MAG: hypothetical protein BAJALOKI3v1_20088 [Candidatus Lokiarchaeota archaeon]